MIHPRVGMCSVFFSLFPLNAEGLSPVNIVSLGQFAQCVWPRLALDTIPSNFKKKPLCAIYFALFLFDVLICIYTTLQHYILEAQVNETRNGDKKMGHHRDFAYISEQDKEHYTSDEADTIFNEVAASYPQATEEQLTIAGENLDSFLIAIYVDKEVTYKEACISAIGAAVEFN